MAALGVRVWTSGLCWALCAFVVGTVTQEFWRGARVRQNATGTDVVTALIGLVSRNKRRYGGYIVHVGIVLIFLGFAGQGYNLDEEAQLKPGQQVKVGGFTVRNDTIKVTDDGAKQMVTAHLTIFEGGKEVGKLYPAKWYFRKHENQPTTEVAMRRTLANDLYIVMPAFDAGSQTASLAVHVNPLVNWVWFGFGILAIGTGIALLPEAAFSFALARMPAGAAVTTSALFLLLLWPAGVFAQSQTVAPVHRTEVRRQLESQIMCMCGCRAPMGSCPMRPNCSHYDEQAVLLDKLLMKGDGPDAVKAAFVQQFGGEDILMAPPDRGFNRLAWLLPYVIGVGGLIAIVVTARRWSHHTAEGTDVQLDAEVDARLEDELRNLD
jgi:cytochrome c-type biogenesis protein CcmF